MQTTSISSSNSRTNRRKSFSMGGITNGPLQLQEASSILSFYETPPNSEISVEDFEMIALARLQVLRNLEQLKLRGIHGEDFRRKMDAVLMEHGLPITRRSRSGLIRPESDLKRDELSDCYLL